MEACTHQILVGSVLNAVGNGNGMKFPNVSDAVGTSLFGIRKKFSVENVGQMIKAIC
jgi:hypothetical protein